VVGRYDLQYSATFYATPTMPLGEATVRVKEITDGMLPAGYRVKLIGAAEEFGKTVGYMLFAFVLAIVLLYMVLAASSTPSSSPSSSWWRNRWPSSAASPPCGWWDTR